VCKAFLTALFMQASLYCLQKQVPRSLDGGQYTIQTVPILLQHIRRFSSKHCSPPKKK